MPKTAKNSIIPAYLQLAVELYFEGTSSDQIAADIEKQYNVKYAGRTIRWWFSEGGPWEDFYNDWASKEIKNRQRAADHTFKANLDKAQGTLAQVMAGRKNMGAAQVMAAKEWLDRGMGKVPDKAFVLTDNVRSFAQWAKQQQELIDEAEQAEAVPTGSDPMDEGHMA
ncbi:MAG TPA: hypothetical protein VFX17_02195 [Patescibacteria group bacterium]|nr:hypothetical protein [Patescibacteria group bacterium]